MGERGQRVGGWIMGDFVSTWLKKWVQLNIITEREHKSTSGRGNLMNKKDPKDVMKDCGRGVRGTETKGRAEGRRERKGRQRCQRKGKVGRRSPTRRQRKGKKKKA